MALQLNQEAYENARKLIEAGRFVTDDRDEWVRRKPSLPELRAFIRQNPLSEYGKWFLGVDETRVEGQVGRYSFLYGDFRKLHRGAVIMIEIQARQRSCRDIELAAAHLREMMDQQILRHTVKKKRAA